MKRGLFFLFCLLPFFLATTYIIRENGEEVGRWEEPDGEDEVRVIDQSPSATTETGERQTAAGKPKRYYFWYENGRGYQSLLREQKKTEKPAALYFYATWCPHCRKFEKETLANNKVIRHLNGFARAKIDVDKEKPLAKQLGIDAFPRFFVRQANGRMTRVHRADTAEAFIERMKAAGLR